MDQINFWQLLYFGKIKTSQGAKSNEHGEFFRTVMSFSLKNCFTLSSVWEGAKTFKQCICQCVGFIIQKLIRRSFRTNCLIFSIFFWLLELKNRPGHSFSTHFLTHYHLKRFRSGFFNFIKNLKLIRCSSFILSSLSIERVKRRLTTNKTIDTVVVWYAIIDRFKPAWQVLIINYLWFVLRDKNTISLFKRKTAYILSYNYKYLFLIVYTCKEHTKIVQM